MTTVNKRTVVAYSCEKMYTLVNDVAAYPEFLPWCEQVDILIQDEEEVRVTLTLSRGGIHKAFTTHNRMQKNKMIELKLVDGPFKHLEGFWRFEEIDENTCAVSLDLEFEFHNIIMEFAMGSVFTQVANTMLDAFCERAKVVYV